LGKIKTYALPEMPTKVPDNEWFAAIDTFLTKYTGTLQADKSLAQYYWHKQTDSAYQIVTNTYNLPDSLQQSNKYSI
jgi:hypothetical protein